MSSRNAFRTEMLPIGRWLSLVRPTIPTGVANLIIIGCIRRCIGHAANLIGAPNLYGIVSHGHRSGQSTVSAPINHSATRQQHYGRRSEEHTSELQSLMSNSYAVLCLKQKKNTEIVYILTCVYADLSSDSVATKQFTLRAIQDHYNYHM